MTTDIPGPFDQASAVIDLSTLPHPDTFPIPDDVQPNARWSPMMIEIADHIGARATLELCARFGGQRVNIPLDHQRNPFREAFGEEVARKISYAFGGEKVDIPSGNSALRHARRQSVLQCVRAGDYNLSQAGRILRLGRRYLSQLINQTDEGV